MSQESAPQYTMSAASRMALTPTLGRDGVAAFDKILASLHACEPMKSKDFLMFCRALHDAGMVDLSTWPEFKGRLFGKRAFEGAGHPSSGLGRRNWTNRREQYELADHKRPATGSSAGRDGAYRLLRPHRTDWDN
jgi:hypothetical protein